MGKVLKLDGAILTALHARPGFRSAGEGKKKADA
jgi:hypothetical protein